MRRTVGIAAGVIGAAAIVFVAASCGSDTTAPNSKTFVAANMSSANEQGPGVTPFTSTGTGTFTFVDAGTEFQWTLDLTNMTGVIASHIHLGDATAVGATAGPVIINLFLPNGPTATLNGRVAHGSFNNANNANISLDSLRVLFNNGHAYANVHTSAHNGGEIRAQIVPQ
jgi:hypothetical protein